MSTVKNNEENIWRAISATGSDAALLIEKLKRLHRPGRRPKSDADFRRLELWWKSFRRRNCDVDERKAAERFIRRHGGQVEKLLGLKRHGYGSLRNAVARGAKASEAVNQRRRTDWRIIPATLAQAVHGRRYQVVTDPNEALLRQAAERLALLGE